MIKAFIFDIDGTLIDSNDFHASALKIVGVLCGGFSEKVLRESGCAEVYRDPADLLENYRKIISL